ncbi:hypothetical protein FSP39_016314 [Pinctada imbricata]|uniref:Tyr recombinase domain-containing protein n=1 Tax=Pinctada imbricata TaxID=66713 RepID=A0AA88YU75_PINIB|nr:hypothetical protein FSP39_016314 [Pinctada imbricata]
MNIDGGCSYPTGDAYSSRALDPKSSYYLTTSCMVPYFNAFVTRGMEFHYQLLRDSFEIKADENGDEYASLTQETLQKNFQGGMCSEEAPQDRRMYAVNESELCPLKVLRFYLDHVHPESTHLFNHCDKEALLFPEKKDTWYIPKPLSKKGFSSFMRDVVKAADLTESYTPHCLRATAIQKMNDAGHEARYIMYMSGHRSESSLRSYNRECSTKQKKDLSMTLACAAAGKESPLHAPVPLALPSATITSPDCDDQRQLAVSNADEQVSLSLSQQNDNRSYMSQFLSTSGFMARSNFENCTFNFKM